MKPQLTPYIFVTLILIGAFSVNAASFIFKQNSITDIHISCFDENNNYCSETTACQINIYYPNQTIIVENASMEWNEVYYNYTLNETQLGVTGEYSVLVFCSGEISGFSTFNFEITPSGQITTTAQSGLSIAIIISILFVMLFFGFISFKLMDYEKLYGIALFFLLISIIIAVYGIYLGVVYSRDYLTPATAGPLSKIFIGILYGLIGMIFLSLIWLILKALAEFKERKSLQQHGTGYNLKTKQYNY